MNGVEGFEPCLTLRLNDLKAGEYYFLYKPDFKPWHKIRRLNIVLYSQFMQKRTAEELLVLEKMRASVSTLENKSSDNLLQNNRTLSKNKSGMSRRSVREMPLHYDERKAISIQRLDHGTFHDSFYKMMEEVSYERYLEGEKFKPVKFADDSDSEEDNLPLDLRRLVNKPKGNTVENLNNDSNLSAKEHSPRLTENAPKVDEL